MFNLRSLVLIAVGVAIAVASDSPHHLASRIAGTCSGNLSLIPLDCGPYTLLPCQTCGTCASSLDLHSGDSDIEDSPEVHIIEPDTEDFPDYEFTEDEFIQYKTLELQYLTEFLKTPMYSDDPVELPYCGINETGMALEKRGLELDRLDLDSRNALNKRGLNFGGIKIDWPKLSRPPAKPVFHPPICIPKRIDNITVHFHIFTTNYSTVSLIKSDTLDQQVLLLNDAYKPLGITFIMGNTSYHIGDKYRKFTQQRRSGLTNEEVAHYNTTRATTRDGPYEDINVFVVETLGIDCKRNSHPTGFCTFPEKPKKYDQYDGCTIIIDELPGVSFRYPEQSKPTTLIHEIGHWFGLRHVFADKGPEEEKSCDGSNDGVPDTLHFPGPGSFEPEQKCCFLNKAKKYEECANKVNVTNYMSYSSIAGTLGPKEKKFERPWTPGQRTKIFTDFFTMRREIVPDGGKVTCEKQPVYFNFTGTSKITARDENAFVGPDILSMPDGLIENLKLACSFPYDPNHPENDLVIDGITGEVLRLPVLSSNCINGTYINNCTKPNDGTSSSSSYSSSSLSSSSSMHFNSSTSVSYSSLWSSSIPTTAISSSSLSTPAEHGMPSSTSLFSSFSTSDGSIFSFRNSSISTVSSDPLAHSVATVIISSARPIASEETMSYATVTVTSWESGNVTSIVATTSPLSAETVAVMSTTSIPSPSILTATAEVSTSVYYMTDTTIYYTTVTVTTCSFGKCAVESVVETITTTFGPTSTSSVTVSTGKVSTTSGTSSTPPSATFTGAASLIKIGSDFGMIGGVMMGLVACMAALLM